MGVLECLEADLTIDCLLELILGLLPFLLRLESGQLDSTLMSSADLGVLLAIGDPLLYLFF